MYFLSRVPTMAVAARLVPAAGRANATQDVKRETDLPRGQGQPESQPSSRGQTKRCDVNFEKLGELLHSCASEPSHTDQAQPLWLIDVRDKNEVAREGKIPTSVNLPLGELKKALLSDCEDFDLAYGFPKPEKHHENVIFYSINHVKSATAVEIAHRLGYRKARHYSGGYDDWITKQMDHMNLKVYQED